MMSFSLNLLGGTGDEGSGKSATAPVAVHDDLCGESDDTLVCDGIALTQRTIDGTCNNLVHKMWGARGYDDFLLLFLFV